MSLEVKFCLTNLSVAAVQFSLLERAKIAVYANPERIKGRQKRGKVIGPGSLCHDMLDQ